MSKFYLVVLILFFPLSSFCKDKQPILGCDKNFVAEHDSFFNKYESKHLEASTNDYNLVHKFIAEELMLSLAMFDATKCSSQTQKMIKHLYDKAATLQKSYEKVIHLENKLETANSDEKKEQYKALSAERKKNLGYRQQFYAARSEMMTYIELNIIPINYE